MPFLQKSFIVHSFFAQWEDGRSANFTASMASPLLHDTFSASSDAVGWRIICRPCQRVGQRHVPFTLNFYSYLIDLTRTYLIDVSFSFQQLARGHRTVFVHCLPPRNYPKLFLSLRINHTTFFVHCDVWTSQKRPDISVCCIMTTFKRLHFLDSSRKFEPKNTFESLDRTFSCSKFMF